VLEQTKYHLLQLAMLLTVGHHLKKHDIQIHRKEERAAVVVVEGSRLKRWNYVGKFQNKGSTQNMQVHYGGYMFEVAVHCHS